MIEKDYAKALYSLTSKSDLLEKMRVALKRRGHEKLLPRIYAEYKKLELAKNRAQMHALITPEKERTRVLLELYRKLVS